jgi:hypothetical protein
VVATRYMKWLVSLILIVTVQISFLKVSDTLSHQYLDEAFKRSLTVFAIARGLNGLISVVQGTEIYATPAGVGVNIALGQALDPINDMVERFSWVMLMSSVSLGIQEFVLEFTQLAWIQVLLAASVLVLLSLLWIKKFHNPRLFHTMFKLFILLAFVRFFVPITLIVNAMVYEQVLQPRFKEAKTALELNYTQSQNLVQSMQRTHQVQQQGWYESLNLSQQLKTMQDKLQRVWKNLQYKFDTSMDYIMVLISIFIVQSVLFPLGFLWILILIYKKLHGLSFDHLFESDR